MTHPLGFSRYTPITSTELHCLWGTFFYHWRVNQATICTCMSHVQENKCTQPGYNSYISLRRVYCFLCIINIRLRCIAYAPFFCLLCSFLVVFMETFRNNIRVRHIVTWNVLNHSMLITQCSLCDCLYRQMLVLLKMSVWRFKLMTSLPSFLPSPLSPSFLSTRPILYLYVLYPWFLFQIWHLQLASFACQPKGSSIWC